MSRTLHAGSYLAAALLGISLLLLLMGLGMSARPEIFAGLGLRDTAKAGLALALTAGIGVLGSAILGWVLNLLAEQGIGDG